MFQNALLDVFPIINVFLMKNVVQINVEVNLVFKQVLLILAMDIKDRMVKKIHFFQYIFLIYLFKILFLRYFFKIYHKIYFSDDVYCAGIKCGPYEKCQFDRKTKREKCVRT